MEATSNTLFYMTYTSWPLRTLVFSLAIASSISSNISAQQICNTTGNLIVFSNYEGGSLDVVIDEDVPDLKIGVTSYDATSLNISGPFAANVTGVIFAGFGANGSSCGYNGPVEVNGVDLSLVTIHTQASGAVQSPFLGDEIIPGLPLVNCMVSGGGFSLNDAGGGNSSPQIVQYFLSEFGPGTVLRSHWTDYSCWLPGGYDLSDGGNCCLEDPVTPPNPIYIQGGTYDFGLPDEFDLCDGPVELDLSYYPVLFQPTAYNGYQWSDGQSGEVVTFDSPGTYSFTVNDYCYSGNTFLTETFTIIPCGPDISLTSSVTEVCPGGSLDLQVLILDGQGPFTYTWNPTLVNSAGPITVSPTSSQSYTVTVTDANGNSATDDLFITVLSELPALSLGPDQSICDDIIVLDASLPGALAYEWSDGSTFATLAVDAPGNYSVVVTGECNLVSDDILVSSSIPLSFSLTEDTTICPGAVATLTVTSATAIAYQWNTGATTPSITASSQGVYEVTVFGECEQQNGSVTLDIRPALFNPLEARYLLCEGESIELDASDSGADLYLWSNGSEGSSEVFAQSESVTLEISDACGSLNISTRIEETLCDCTFYIPNTFTPDGDLINDTFVPVYESCSFLDYTFSVYDRWGAEVFRTSIPNSEWNGSIDKGDYFAPDGSYTYLISATVVDRRGNLNTLFEQGVVTIIR
ncbi:MAG: gliding motility-associated C-terminal domain-containing protein [Bacteroidetes bacterium]|nr:gliding motility-associated C-terminal domain-containing protein [Bacteroidota bacterium]